MKFIAPILLIAAALLAFTEPGGGRVWVSPSEIVTVAEPRDCLPAAKARLTLSNGAFLCVRETVDVVIERVGK